MTELRTTFPDQNVIPVPQRIDDATERAAWAARTAQGFSTVEQPVPDAAARIAAALDDLARLRDDAAAVFLIVNGDAAVLAPFAVYRTGAPLSRDELIGYLATVNTALPPTGSITSAAQLGDGFSSSLLHARPEGQYATRRWVFFGQDEDIAAILGPVVPLGLAHVEEIAEQVLVNAELSAFVPAGDPELLEALMAATERSGDTWQVPPVS